MKKINYVLIILSLLFFFFSSVAQNEKNIILSIAKGKITTPYYEKSTLGNFYNLDIDYYLTSRSILTSGFSIGNHKFFDPLYTGNGLPIYSDGTNAKAEYNTFILMYKYILLKKKALNIDAGLGVGIMTHLTQRLASITSTSGEYQFLLQQGFTDVVFPLKIDLDYKITSLLKLGVMSGIFIHPDFPIAGYNAGIKLSILVK